MDGSGVFRGGRLRCLDSWSRGEIELGLKAKGNEARQLADLFKNPSPFQKAPHLRRYSGFSFGPGGLLEWETPMSGTAMQFVRVISRVGDMEIWNANKDGFSFVISYESRGGSGLQGRDGFVASWRPIYQNRCAIKVGGSPFKSLTEAEEACKAMLGYLTNELEQPSPHGRPRAHRVRLHP